MSQRRSYMDIEPIAGETPRVQLNILAAQHSYEPPPPYSARSYVLPSARCRPSVGRFPQLVTESDLRNKRLCKVTFQFHAPNSAESYTVEVHQQPAGANNVVVFKGVLEDGDLFTIVSLRQPFYPFALTFFLNFQKDCRISVCCEQRHNVGYRFPTRTGTFSVNSIQGGRPCHFCRALRGANDTQSQEETDGTAAKDQLIASPRKEAKSPRKQKKKNKSLDLRVKLPPVKAQVEASVHKELQTPQSSKLKVKEKAASVRRPSVVTGTACCCFEKVSVEVNLNESDSDSSSSSSSSSSRADLAVDANFGYGGNSAEVKVRSKSISDSATLTVSAKDDADGDQPRRAKVAADYHSKSKAKGKVEVGVKSGNGNKNAAQVKVGSKTGPKSAKLTVAGSKDKGAKAQVGVKVRSRSSSSSSSSSDSSAESQSAKLAASARSNQGGDNKVQVQVNL